MEKSHLSCKIKFKGLQESDGHKGVDDGGGREKYKLFWPQQMHLAPEAARIGIQSPAASSALRATSFWENRRLYRHKPEKQCAVLLAFVRGVRLMDRQRSIEFLQTVSLLIKQGVKCLFQKKHE
ncbi:unnamed protein product [Arctia plantaginis]|uniref:Uncharacterized protein n=1 Tax=Arctia plantaginis TaxID=874455 RepID=A0A8S1BQG8_ARCPL|nr:unnamed protein product [Arctia plantaginis]